MLGCAPTAAASELRRCYISRSKQVHPDRAPAHARGAATAAFQQLAHAYDVLGQETLRSRYDDDARVKRKSRRRDDSEVVIDKALDRVGEMVATARTWWMLLVAELMRVRRVWRCFLRVRFWDLRGRVRLAFRVIRVILAVPVRVDRALRMRRERDRKAGKVRGASGGLLNERVRGMLEFIVGSELEDREEDEELMGAI